MASNTENGRYRGGKELRMSKQMGHRHADKQTAVTGQVPRCCVKNQKAGMIWHHNMAVGTQASDLHLDPGTEE